MRGLPHGLDTVVGDRGVRLSGGERQRIVLARALLRKPALLILDEATSALDTVNEDRIRQALDRLKGEMTILVIAHRLSTIRNADQVIVLERGRVVRQEHARVWPECSVLPDSAGGKRATLSGGPSHVFIAVVPGTVHSAVSAADPFQQAKRVLPDVQIRRPAGWRHYFTTRKVGVG